MNRTTKSYNNIVKMSMKKLANPKKKWTCFCLLGLGGIVQTCHVKETQVGVSCWHSLPACLSHSLSAGAEGSKLLSHRLQFHSFCRAPFTGVSAAARTHLFQEKVRGGTTVVSLQFQSRIPHLTHLPRLPSHQACMPRAEKQVPPPVSWKPAGRYRPATCSKT